MADGLVASIDAYPKGIGGRGIVTTGGGYTYFTNAWVLVRMLRHLGCNLPVQLWYLGREEVNKEMERIISRFGVECVDAKPILEKKVRIPKGRALKLGWVLKSVAIARCPFEEVIFIDADNFPLRDPSFLFKAQPYRNTGAIFWPDINAFTHPSVWSIFRVPPREEPEFESGQIVVDKRINWEAVSLAEKINCRADVFFRLMWGDKDTFRFAWHKLGRIFAMPQFPAQALQAPGMDADMLCQHDFDGNRLFQHRNLYKWNLFGENPWIPGFFYEHECRSFLKELQSAWNGRCINGSRLERSPQASSFKRALCDKVWLIELPEPVRDQLLRQKLLSNLVQPFTHAGNYNRFGLGGKRLGVLLELGPQRDLVPDHLVPLCRPAPWPANRGMAGPQSGHLCHCGVRRIGLYFFGSEPAPIGVTLLQLE